MNKLIPLAYGAMLNSMALVSPKRAGRKAFFRFCRPARPPLRERHKSWLEASRYKLMDTPYGPVQVYKWGSGPKKVLFAHGWQSHSYFWRGCVERLPAGWTAYSMDAPGHGLTGGNYFNAVVWSYILEQLTKEEGHMDSLVTHSLGGLAALYTNYRMEQELPWSRVALLAVPYGVQPYFDYFVRICKLNKRVQAGYKKALFQELKISMEDIRAPLLAAGMTIPALLVYDSADKEAPMAVGEGIHKVLPDAELHITEGLGHKLCSEAVTDRVMAFACGTASGAEQHALAEAEA